jgi:hypothetical protein
MTEDALDGLAHEDEIVIRRNYCADSHLDGADLRVVASVAAAGEPAARCAADEAAQRLWSSWLAGYLSEHRCT